MVWDKRVNKSLLRRHFCFTGALCFTSLALRREASSFLRQGIGLRLCSFAVVHRETK
ncbi:hypothetical protein DV515_00007135, partial [Chloebia gouldiae]